MNIGYNEYGVEPKRTVLYRNFHEISGRIYLVEISRNPKKVFILLFENFEDPSSYIVEVLLEKIAQKLMNDCQNLFENLVQTFTVKYGKLQIQGYHTKNGLPDFTSVKKSNTDLAPSKMSVEDTPATDYIEDPYASLHNNYTSAAATTGHMSKRSNRDQK